MMTKIDFKFQSGVGDWPAYLATLNGHFDVLQLIHQVIFIQFEGRAIEKPKLNATSNSIESLLNYRYIDL